MTCAITSEYPSAIKAMNLSNESLFGKLFFEKDYNKKLPNYYKLTDDEKASYNEDPASFFLEVLGENDILDLGSIFLNLPSVSTVIDDFKREFIEKG